MNTVRMGVIALCAAVGVGGYFSLRGAATDEAQPAQATRAQPANFAAANRVVGPRAQPALDVRTLDTAREPALEADTSDLVQPSQTRNQVFDALNADIGPEGEYVDPQVLAELLRPDPELGRLLNE
jgi:hypothetical protein